MHNTPSGKDRFLTCMKPSLSTSVSLAGLSSSASAANRMKLPHQIPLQKLAAQNASKNASNVSKVIISATTSRTSELNPSHRRTLTESALYVNPSAPKAWHLGMFEIGKPLGK